MMRHEQDMRELLDEQAYWGRLYRRAVLEQGDIRPEDSSLGRCLLSITREIDERRASCPCDYCQDA